MKKQIIYIAGVLGLCLVGTVVWTMTARAEYESAEYKVIETDGNIEIREYPDLLLVATNSKPDAKGRDGSFMRLFQYISGANKAEQKIEMTTPVFMEPGAEESEGSMGFVLPKEVAKDGAPEPNAEGVRVRQRKGGRFVVIRFPGSLNTKLAKEQEVKLRDWMKTRDLEGESVAETAGYDAPFTPPPLRRNEILVRVKAADSEPKLPATAE